MKNRWLLTLVALLASASGSDVREVPGPPGGKTRQGSNRVRCARHARPRGPEDLDISIVAAGAACPRRDDSEESPNSSGAQVRATTTRAAR